MMILLKANNLGEAIVQGAIKYIIIGLVVWGLVRLFSKKEKK